MSTLRLTALNPNKEPKYVYHKGNCEETFFGAEFLKSVQQFIPKQTPKKDKRQNIWMTRDSLAKHGYSVNKMDPTLTMLKQNN